MEEVLAEAASTVVASMAASLAVGSAEGDFADVGLENLGSGPITADTILTRTAIITRTEAATWSAAVY
jgi:hypothetical protein